MELKLTKTEYSCIITYNKQSDLFMLVQDLSKLLGLVDDEEYSYTETQQLQPYDEKDFRDYLEKNKDKTDFETIDEFKKRVVIVEEYSEDEPTEPEDDDSSPEVPEIDYCEADLLCLEPKTAEPDEVKTVELPNKLVAKNRAEFVEFLKHTDITPTSYRNYAPYWVEKIWDLVDNPTDLINYLRLQTSSIKTNSKSQYIYRLFTLFFKFNNLKSWITLEADLTKLKELFDIVKAQKKLLEKKKIP